MSKLLKKCSCCQVFKDRSMFYKDRSRYDGIATKCKPCDNAYWMKGYRKTRRFSKNYKKRAVARNRKWRGANKQKCLAHQAVSRAISKGVLVKPKNCERCGASSKLHGHHNDYRKQLKVIWLCVTCHEKEHHEK